MGAELHVMRRLVAKLPHPCATSSHLVAVCGWPCATSVLKQLLSTPSWPHSRVAEKVLVVSSSLNRSHLCSISTAVLTRCEGVGSVCCCCCCWAVRFCMLCATAAHMLAKQTPSSTSSLQQFV